MILKRTTYLSLLFFLLNHSWALGQTSEDKHAQLEVGLNYLSGFVIKHDKYMGHLAKGITRGFEMSLARKSLGKNAWQRLTNYPDVGLSFSFYNYPNPVIGETFALNSFSDYYLIKSKRFFTTFRLGIGLAYHTNPFDKDKNTKNIVYGSPVTFSLRTKLVLKYKITQDWLISGSVGLSHFSFADLKRPNMGLNVFAGYVGVKYLLGETEEYTPPQESDGDYSKKLRYSVNFNGSIVHYKVIEKTVYPAISFSAHVQKPLSKIFDLELGIDLFNDMALVEVIKNDTELDDNDHPDHKRAGISTGIEYHMNKLSLQVLIGYYIYEPYKAYGKVYQRYGLKYYVSDHIYLSAGFKSHRADAENAEFGLGYRF